MVKKKRFKPTITRVKLNPEQAVLTCSCYNTGQSESNFFAGFFNFNSYCVVGSFKFTSNEFSYNVYDFGGTSS